MHKEESINLISLFQNFYRYKWSILFILSSSIIITFFYIKRIVPIYSSHILISIENEKTSNITSLFPNNNIVNIDMEDKLDYNIQILKSRRIIANVLKKIDLSKRFFIEKKWQEKELYKQDIPFIVNYKSTKLNNNSLTFILTELDNKHFTLMIKGDEEDTKRTYRYQQTIFTKNYNLMIHKKHSLKPLLQQTKYLIKMENDKDRLISTILNNLSIQKKVTNLLNISYQDRIPQRAKDILSTLVLIYKEYNLQAKQLKSRKNIAFFDKMIIDMEKILAKTGKELKEYKSQHSELLFLGSEDQFFFNTLEKKEKLMKLSMTLKALRTTQNRIQQSGVYSSSLLDNNNLKTSEINLLINKLRKKEEYLALLYQQQEYPSTLLSNNPAYERLLVRLKELKKKQIKLTLEYTSEYSEVITIQESIEKVETELRQYINSNINSYLDEIRKLKTELNKTINTLIHSTQEEYNSIEETLNKNQTTIDKLPTSTMRLRELERIFELNNNNQKRLQQKRSESLIAKKSTISNIHIVDNATLPTNSIKPKKGFLYLSGLLLGFILSIIYSSLRLKKEAKIYNKNDISLNKYSLIYHEMSKSKDNFWTLISSLEALKRPPSSKIILITSSDYGENKNLVTKQLALGLIHISKKVLIIDFDIYHAALTQHFQKEDSIGLSTLLTSPHHLEEINIYGYIHPLTSQYKTLDFLSSGPILPNASTLLFNPNIFSLFQELSQRYDYILLNTPPMGKYPQTKILLKYIDVLLVVAQMNKTDKKLLNKFNEIEEENIEKILFLTDTE